MKELGALILLVLAYLLIKGGAWVMADVLSEAFPIAFTAICVIVIAVGAFKEEGCGCGCLVVIAVILALILL